MRRIFSESTEAVIRRCSVEKVFLEISHNSQENTCVRVSFLIKLKKACNIIKKRFWDRFFSVNFENFLRIPSNEVTGQRQ